MSDDNRWHSPIPACRNDAFGCVCVLINNPQRCGWDQEVRGKGACCLLGLWMGARPVTMKNEVTELSRQFKPTVNDGLARR